MQHGKHTRSGAIVVKHCGQAQRSGTAVKHRKARAESMPLYLVLFFLDTTSTPKQNFTQLFWSEFLGDAVSVSGLRGNACAICPAGRYSASIQIAPLADTGCGPTTRPQIIAAIAANSSATFRHHLGPGCECGLGHSAGTGRGCDHAREFGSAPLRYAILTNPLHTQRSLLTIISPGPAC